MHEAVATDGSRVSLGGRNNEPQVIEDILAFYEARHGEPALVLFFSDGGVAKNAQIARLLREASNRPVFWQFIGLGHGRYGILEKLDTLDGRLIDNAGFFAVDDTANITDTELYQRIFSEFPSWLKISEGSRTTAGLELKKPGSARASQEPPLRRLRREVLFGWTRSTGRREGGAGGRSVSILCCTWLPSLLMCSAKRSGVSDFR
ncbi:VWA domain-containing protein [Actinomadura sp. NPDC048955]|uniref:VWA domain-containing protein n=1 Tax=Actinomadura sp. NPDC048955 TaxID=3158228 RepID=UPI0033E3DAC2